MKNNKSAPFLSLTYLLYLEIISHAWVVKPTADLTPSPTFPENEYYEILTQKEIVYKPGTQGGIQWQLQLKVK
ncbi:MAG: hypothetical protein ACUZ8N_01685 [Candidatus Scalindua sp.]